MKQTLLELVQTVLSDMDSDEVNSIDDTAESAQVANILRDTYFAMISNRNWPHTKKTIQLQPSLDTARPTHMSVAENVKEVVFIKYNVVKQGETRKRYTDMKWKEPDEFLRVNNQLNSDNSNVEIITDYSGVEFLIRNDVAPTCYTSFDDINIVFDAFDNTVDNTLQASKIQAQGYVIPAWTHEDEFIPDLPMEAFPALAEEAKSKATIKLKQIPDQKAEQESVRQQRWLSRKAWTVNGGIRYPDYGRKTRKSSSVFKK